MEFVKGRGICCENEVYFDYVDGEVVMTMYRDVPGVRMDRRAPNVIKSFSINQWEEINGYLRETLDEVEGVFDDRDEGEGEAKEAESSPLFQQVTDNEVEVPTVVSSLPVMSGTVPEAVGDDKGDKKENGKG